MSNEYHFVTRWRLRGSAQDVAEVLRDARDPPHWWPSVYLDVRVIDDGDAAGIGRTVDLWTKGWLPWLMRPAFRADVRAPRARTEARQLRFVGTHRRMYR